MMTSIVRALALLMLLTSVAFGVVSAAGSASASPSQGHGTHLYLAESRGPVTCCGGPGSSDD
jgi:hypothetical protein